MALAFLLRSNVFMNKYFRFILPAIAILFLVLHFASVASAQGAGVLREILKRMDNNNKSLTSFKGNIKMNKFNAQLGENDLTEGDAELSAWQDARSRSMCGSIGRSRSRRTLLIANGSTSSIVRERNKRSPVRPTVRKGNAKSGGALAFMTMSKAQLKANYDVKYAGEETVSERRKHISSRADAEEADELQVGGPLGRRERHAGSGEDRREEQRFDDDPAFKCSKEHDT